MKEKINQKSIDGFSKLNKRGKIKWIVENFFKDPESVMHELMSYWHRNEDQQKVLDGFSENTISNFPMPFSVAPNLIVNDKTYCVPMVTEESSVVAAASYANKYWMERGGVHAEIIGTKKIGQIHFFWDGDLSLLQNEKSSIEKKMRDDAKNFLFNMEQRGGGLTSLNFLEHEGIEKYYEVQCSFETCNSMGANFINSCLESFSQSLENYIIESESIPVQYKNIDILMSILSNYTPECLVRVWVECKIEELGIFAEEMKADIFANRFYKAVQIAKEDSFRAVTHNKGILNGIDAVIIATGNDFRAVEACCHAYASKDGRYKGLSDCSIENEKFRFSLEVPIALGTIGGLTNLHPMAKRSLELLENPNASELMMITAATGLMQNFAAIRSLITTGIQQGHMKMHLDNILNHLLANEIQRKKAKAYFENKTISFNAVRQFLLEIE